MKNAPIPPTPFTEHRLGNGLTVLLSEDHSAPLAALVVMYHVGSKNETRTRTGFAHLFEHLMFKGSKSVGDGEHFRLLQEIGASVNGSTSEDRTNYYEVVPRTHLELALFLESDRMGGLLEALSQAAAGGRPTLLVAYDIEARGPLATVVTSRGVLGVGVVLAPAAGLRTLARLRWRTVPGTERTAPLARNLAAVADNAMAGCMPFCEAVAMRQPRIIRMGLSPSLLLEMEFDFPESP